MRMPGFTAEVGLYRVNKSSHMSKFQEASEKRKQIASGRALIPQFGTGTTRCYWRCYPLSGCEYVCQFLPQ